MFTVTTNRDGTTECYCVEGNLCISFNSQLVVEASVSDILTNRDSVSVSIEGLIVLRDYLTDLINKANANE